MCPDTSTWFLQVCLNLQRGENLHLAITCHFSAWITILLKVSDKHTLIWCDSAHASLVDHTPFM